MTVAGVHLMPHVAARADPPPSAVAVLDDAGTLVDLRLAGDDEEVVAGVPPGTSVACVDAPLVVPEGGGRRDVERVLAWCDVPAFPVTAARMRTVYGGARGPALAPRLAARADRVLEALPDLVLRTLAWEREHPPGAPPLDLAEYRARWLAVRAPARRGRAATSGLLAGHLLLSAVVDLGGWAPAGGGDEARQAADAARLDAALCAYAALRLHRGEAATVLGTPERGQLALLAGADLRARLDLHLARLRAEGAVGI